MKLICGAIGAANKGDGKPDGSTYSWRLRWRRSEFQQDWLTVRMNSPGWGQEGDRLEIPWGPGYADRCDYLVFEGDQIRSFFAPLPNAVELAMIDKWSELESFDPEQGFRSIGVTVSRPRARPDTESYDVMY